jgi:hypothetical protein
VEVRIDEVSVLPQDIQDEVKWDGWLCEYLQSTKTTKDPIPQTVIDRLNAEF